MSSQPRVLIVDDEERFRTTMCKLLTVRGLFARTAGGGKEALEELQRDSFDLVLLDIRMPEIGGVELLSRIREIAPDIEAIVMTGYASVDTAKEIMKLGSYDYLLKPYNIDELMEKIEGAYDRKVARNKLAGGKPETEPA